eukprot:TRINITY_DN771_c1_g1_i2.p1 TRINITY_DN771_c1_g1~~TRINITY_DN771_c1_g1_i2.p1  ORF type:complete len:480 (+),score=98.93 TRINITY_DN771_c1_g1_i2:130-1569(+)
MASSKNLAIFFAVGILLSTHFGANGHTIKHVVVLMLENRSFDHMLGFLKQSLNPEIDGLTGTESNPINPFDTESPSVFVSDDAPYVTLDPGHSFGDATQQIYGGPEHPENRPMNGFLANGLSVDPVRGRDVLKAFNRTWVPAISTLVQEFAVFDRWYSSMPGPTQTNRLFVHSATSHGMGTNDVTTLIQGVPQDSIYDRLYKAKKSFRVYFEEVSTTLFFQNMRKPKYWSRLKKFSRFLEDCADGELPDYSFIEPRYFDYLGKVANDQHPQHDVAPGEVLIKKIYEALRASPQWNDSLLIITYDEHGGFYDHVPPPQGHIPNPDGFCSLLPPFNFTRLGVRVPTVMISPWINKGTVVHEPADPNKHYEHSSIPATVKLLFGLPDFLTARDAWAATFEGVFSQRASPRVDCPKELPSPPIFMPWRSVDSPVSGLQLEFMEFVSALHGGTDESWKNITSEYRAAEYVNGMFQNFLGRNEPL